MPYGFRIGNYRTHWLEPPVRPNKNSGETTHPTMFEMYNRLKKFVTKYQDPYLEKRRTEMILVTCLRGYKEEFLVLVQETKIGRAHV